MMQRRTHKAALRHARACIAQAQVAAEKTGAHGDVKAWLECAMRNTADTLPIDMRQISNLANAFFKIGLGRLGDRGASCHSIDEFLKFCKDNAK